MKKPVKDLLKLNDYIKIVALDATYIFVVEKFFIWNYFEFKNVILSSQNLFIFFK